MKMNENTKQTGNKAARSGMFLVAIGIVYGDIGTSPMYVMKSLVHDNGGFGAVEQDFIIGSLSLIIWTITILTTVKYVLIAMRADNHGEGGIFALYSLVKKYSRWLIFPAVIGGAALLADGILTPAVTVTTAIEGLRSIETVNAFLGPSQNAVILITLLIIAVLFGIQRAGTSLIGSAFGPVMTVWFLFLGCTGIYRIAAGSPAILQAFNPILALKVLVSSENHIGFMILGNVFLATTGAEALYSDMGHVGRKSIYRTWPFVKLCLILNYLGQGSWLIKQAGNESLTRMNEMNPFYLMLPESLRLIAIVLGAVAAVIASQALITGSFTLVAEAIRLNLMPHMQINYPSKTKEQLYIPLVNTFIWAGCSLVVLYFKSSTKMEAAYGLAITLTMLMTTLLLTVYLFKIRKKPLPAILFGLFFTLLEGIFFTSSLSKLTHGGYVTLFITLILLTIMAVWYKGTEVEESQSIDLEIQEFLPQLTALANDNSVPYLTDNLVYFTKIDNPQRIERDILYSILNKGPKKAKAYWLLHVVVTEHPYTREYQVETYGTNLLFHITLRLGYKTPQRINIIYRQVVQDLIQTGELPHQTRPYSIYPGSLVGNFVFCLIHKTLSLQSRIPASSRNAIHLKYAIRHLAGSKARWYGLENSTLLIEYVPLFIEDHPDKRFKRV